MRLRRVKFLREKPRIEIFVFGSNLGGNHGAGAALHAWKFEGAVTGKAQGLQGTSYAIPTKDYMIRTLPLDRIREYVDTFIAFAKENRDKYVFNVTPIGCGMAGYRPSQIAPMFRKAPDNVRLPKEFLLWLN